MKNNVSNFARYTLVGKEAENMSTIEINYYIQKMCELYGKIVIINRLNKMLSDTHSDFVYLNSSTPISEIISHNKSNNYIGEKISVYPNHLSKYSFSNESDIQLFFNLLKKYLGLKYL